METTIESPISLEEACSYLQIHEQTMYKWIREGRFPKQYIHRLGRKVLFLKSELYQFLKQS